MGLGLKCAWGIETSEESHPRFSPPSVSRVLLILAPNNPRALKEGLDHYSKCVYLIQALDTSLDRRVDSPDTAARDKLSIAKQAVIRKSLIAGRVVSLELESFNQVGLMPS